MPPFNNQTLYQGGHFATVLQGDAHFHSHYGQDTKGSQKGLESLYKNVAVGAFHDAAERSDPPKCHPQTRVAILKEMMSWIKDPAARRKFIVWLYGPAGSGKSAIAQTIAELCALEDILGASFFFSRTGINRNDTSRFIASIAYQLTTSIPEIRSLVSAAVEKEPLVFSRSLATQLQTIILDPFNEALASGLIQRPTQCRLVIIDGLDEARDESSQTELLMTLVTCIEELHFPLIFILASRPEYAIRQSFNKEPLQTFMKGLALDDEQYQPDDDIRTFLDSKFSEIRGSHPSSPGISSSWPLKDDVDYLVDKSSGQFIYASTAMKYINSPRHNPVTRLNIVRGLRSPGNDTPFAQLDALYNLIFKSVDDNISKIMEILSLLFLSTEPGYDHYLTVAFIEELLGYETGDVYSVLTDMHALVHVPLADTDADRLRLYHKSLHDFLMDKSRSENYFLDAGERHADLALHLLRYINNIRFSENTEDRILSLLNGFVVHFTEASRIPNELITALDSFSLSTLLSKLSLQAIYATKWDDFTNRLRKENDTSTQQIFLRLLSEFDSWIWHRLNQYPQKIQDCVSASFSIPRYIISDMPDIFEIVSHALPISEASKLAKMDRTHFQFQDISGMSVVFDRQDKNMFNRFFTNASRSKTRYGDGTKFAQLAKYLVRGLYREPDGIPIVIEDRPHDIECSDVTWYSRLKLQHTDFIYFSSVLKGAALDLELVQLLWDCVILKIVDDAIVKARRNMAIASFEYIERCRIPIPSKDHILTHSPGCEICARHGPILNQHQLDQISKMRMEEQTSDEVVDIRAEPVNLLATANGTRPAAHSFTLSTSAYNVSLGHGSITSVSVSHPSTPNEVSRIPTAGPRMRSTIQPMPLTPHVTPPEFASRTTPSLTTSHRRVVSDTPMPAPQIVTMVPPISDTGVHLSAPLGFSFAQTSVISLPSPMSINTHGFSGSIHRRTSMEILSAASTPTKSSRKPFWKRMFHIHR